jgi:hypothetical protein
VGTTPEAIHLAEERGAFGRVLAEAGLTAPMHGMASSYDEAAAIAAEIGYPVLVRPSYVLGGRGMEIVYDDGALEGYIARATAISPEHPVLVDRFIDDAVEIDVDAIFDGEELFLGGVMEHIEEAGIHSGDSACALPPITLGDREIGRIREATEAIARGVGVLGLINIQFALGSDVLYVLEANPRASRTVPFVSKATATPLAKAAARVMLGDSIKQLRGEGMLPASGDGGSLPSDSPIAVKEAVMPFNRFRQPDGLYVDTVLGPVITEVHRDRIEAYVASARDQGATLATGGARPDLDAGYFVAPTLVVDATPDMTVVREEIFGPVIVVVPFDDEDEAVALANASEFGLYDYVFSADSARAYGVAQQLRTGNVGINTLQRNHELPFGGFKMSGVGRDGGRFGFHAYSELQSIVWPG